MPLRYGSASDVGRRRSSNQDTLLADPALQLFLIADGMGGYEGGEIASRLIVDSVQRFVAETVADDERTWPFEYDLELSHQANRLKAAVLVANRRLADLLGREGRPRGMGATLAAALIGTRSAVVSNVGDCRAYLLRDGLLRQLTRDHSWVAEQVASGFITADSARAHPWRHMVTRAVQGDANLLVDTAELEFRAGDRFLLCSDGLHGVLGDDRIADILTQTPQAGEACSTLIDAANGGGSPDNVSVIVVDVAGETGAV